MQIIRLGEDCILPIIDFNSNIVIVDDNLLGHKTYYVLDKDNKTAIHIKNKYRISHVVNGDFQEICQTTIESTPTGIDCYILSMNDDEYKMLYNEIMEA